MTQKEKLIERFKSLPKDFTWMELIKLLNIYGFSCDNKGKTSGSRVEFIREKDGKSIILHKPHPGNIIKEYALKQTLDRLVEYGDITL